MIAMRNNQEGKVGWIFTLALGNPDPDPWCCISCMGAPETALLQKVLANAVMALGTNQTCARNRQRHRL
jgi:hypothetical protein